jgi:hypothetical protein
MNTQQRVIASLFAFSILLLTANIIIGKVLNTENKIIPPRNLSGNEIDSLFRIAVQNFGLPASIMKNQKINEVSMSEGYSAFVLNLPKDLPIPVFIAELNEIFSGYEAGIFTEEKKISGRTLIKISSEDEIRLAAYIDYNKDLVRNSSTVGFLITIDDKTQKSDIDKLLDTPEPFAFLFTPSEVLKTFIKTEPVNKKQFAIVLGDETIDLDFKFESGYSERRLKSSVRNLLGAFSQAAFFIIDDNSSFYESKIYSFVENEFTSRKIKLIKKSRLNLINSSMNNISEHFSELMQSIENNGSMMIVCSPTDFIGLLGDIRSYRKIGYKYLLPSEILLSL